MPPLTQACDDAASRLFREHRGYPYIILAIQDFAREDEATEFNVRKSFLVARGVDPQKILGAYNTHDTVSEVRQALSLLGDIAPGLKSVITCHHELHVSRAWPTAQRAAGGAVKVYAEPVQCNTYVNCRMPVWWRRLSVRYEWVFAWYMVATWVAWRWGIIK